MDVWDLGFGFPKGTLMVVPSFFYDTEQGEGRRRGYIGARDERHARELLLSLGIHPKALSKEDPPPPRGPVFSFQGEKQSGERVKGTVEAVSKEDAEKKLSREYGLMMQSLECAPTSPPPSLEDRVRVKSVQEPRDERKPHRALWRFLRGRQPKALSMSNGGTNPSYVPRTVALTAGWLLFFTGLATAISYYQMRRVAPFRLALFERVAGSETTLLLLLSLCLVLLFMRSYLRGRSHVVFFAVLGILIVVFTSMAM